MWEKEVRMKRFSLFLSYAFCYVGLLVILFFAAALPSFQPLTLASVPDAERYAVATYILCYLILALVLLADICLLFLLHHVLRGTIFTKRSVQLLRVISWASILTGFLACPLFFIFSREALFVAFVALFLGVVLRVVKQVIEKATALKEENDATI